MLPATEKPSPAIAPHQSMQLLAGVLADAAGGVDDVELALLAALVGRDEAPHHGLGAAAPSRSSSRPCAP